MDTMIIFWMKSNKAIKASTIMETLVAMVILLMILSLFFINIDKVNYSSNPYVLYKAFQITNGVFKDDKILLEFDEPINEGRFQIQKTIEALIMDELYVVEINVLDPNQRMIFTRKKIISTRIDV